MVTQELLYLNKILNDSAGFLRELHKEDTHIVTLDHVKVACFSETVHRTKGVMQPGRGGFYPFARIQYSVGRTKKEGYAQIRCIFQAVDVDKSKRLCFLVRCVYVLTCCYLLHPALRYR